MSPLGCVRLGNKLQKHKKDPWILGDRQAKVMCPGGGGGQDRGEGKARGAPDEESVSQHIFDCKKHTRIYVLSYASIFNVTLIIHFVFVEIKFTFIKGIFQWLLVYLQCCAIITTISRKFHHLRKKPHTY